MSIWLLYSSHNRQIYLFKLHRIHELEKQLGMLQHLRFRKDFKNGYRVSSKGYYLDGLIYIFVSFGSQVITLNTAYKDSWNTENIIFFSAVPVLVIYIMIKVKIAERNAKHLILKLERSVGTG